MTGNYYEKFNNRKKSLDSNIIAMEGILFTLYFLYKIQKNTFMENGVVFSKTEMEIDKLYFIPCVHISSLCNWYLYLLILICNQ